MFKFIFIIIFFLCSCQAREKNISPLVAKYVDTILELTERTSLFRNNVDWKKIRLGVYQRAGNAQKKEDVLPAIQYIFDELSDKHGGLIYEGKRIKSENFRLPKFRKGLREEAKRQVGRIRIGTFHNEYGYIRVPSLMALTAVEINKYTQEIQDSVCKLNPQKLSGWIIDLRLNIGGNMFPMIAGIGNLIGDGPVGYFADINGNLTTQWVIKNGELFFDHRQLTDIKVRCPLAILPKIVVLTSELTSSAGEATAIALKGRANTLFIGEKTAGYVTANNVHTMDTNSLLLVAESFEADRNKFVYRDVVTPDIEMVEGDNFSDLNKDRKIIAAIKWLSER